MSPSLVTDDGGSCVSVGVWNATRVLVGRDDRLFPEAFQRRVALERLGIEAETIPGGHLAPLSDPEGVADHLVRSAPPGV